MILVVSSYLKPNDTSFHVPGHFRHQMPQHCQESYIPIDEKESRRRLVFWAKLQWRKKKHIIHPVVYQYRIVTFMSYTGFGEESIS
jgi:hypothetical protein